MQLRQALAVLLVVREEFCAKTNDEEDGQHHTRKRRPIERNRERRNDNIFNDYLINSSTYTNDHFQRRFRVTIAIFRQLCSSAAAADSFFRPRKDATGRLGHSKGKTWPRLYGYSFIRSHLINPTIFCEGAKRVSLARLPRGTTITNHQRKLMRKCFAVNNVMSLV
jgi:hypothetical protein